MAAARSCVCGCTCRLLRAFPRQQLRSGRFFSAYAENDYQEGNENKSQAVRRRKKRDPLAVLKVLSSTVQQVPGTPSVGFFEDAYLTPRSDYTKREYLAAYDSGRDAAEFIIRKYPELCKLREPVPNWPDEYAVFEEREDEETLNYLLKSEKIDAAVSLFEILKQKGERISLKSTNVFLDLVGYHGVGINEIKNKASEASSPDSSGSSDSDSSGEDGENINNSQDDSSKDTYGFKTKFMLSENSYAAKIFTSMDEKNADTYQAYILALLKHGEFQTASQIYDQMRTDGHKGSTFMYNCLLNELQSQKSNLAPEETWKIAQGFVENMREEATHQPDVGTFNALLKLSGTLDKDAAAMAAKLLREMIAHGIQPCLASYLYVIEANERNKFEKYHVLQNVVERVKNHIGGFVVQDPLDVKFFSASMNLARSFNNAEIAKTLYEIAKKDSNWEMLSRSTSAFLGNYICTLARAEKDIDLVFAEYDRLIPNELVPRDWVYTELFRRLEKGEKPARIMKLCKDMKMNRVRLSFPVCERVFAAFSSSIPPEMHKDCLDTALDMMKWMAMFDIPITSLILGQVARLYALNDLLDDAWKTIDLFEEKNLRPNFTMMSAILKQAVAVGDQRFVVKTLKKMTEYNYTISYEQKADILEKLDLGVRERIEIENLIETRLS